MTVHRNKAQIDATILGLFNEDGVWVGSTGRKIIINSEVIDIDEWAEETGLTLPDSE